MIEVRCECGHKMVIFPHHAGTMMDCPKCGAANQVPGEPPPKPKPGPVIIEQDNFFTKLIKLLRGD